MPDWLVALAAMLLALVIAALVLGLGGARLGEPFAYDHDANSAHMVIKGVLDNGWYQHNPALGFPYVQDLRPYAFVSGDTLQILAVKLFGAVGASPATAMNLLFLLGFPLAALTAYIVLRLWRLSQLSSLVAAVLFAVAPYHFLHGEGHVFISAYYSVPLAIYLIVETWRGTRLVERRARAHLLLLGAACLVIGSSHVYYAAFAILLLGIAAAVRGLAERSVRAALVLAIPAVAITLVVAVNHLPNIVYGASHSADPALKRQASESEQLGLKAASMLLPVEAHRLAPLARLRARYEAQTDSQTGEGAAQALGTLGSLGVIGLLGLLLAGTVRRRVEWESSPAPALAATAVTAFLLGTVGGGSMLFALLVTPELRAWARISIFIGFCGLAAVALAMDWLFKRAAFRAALALGAAAVVLLAGVLDQTTSAMKPDYQSIHARWTSDARFTSAVESRLPSGSGIFELPYEPFPEPQIAYAPPPGASTYDGVRPYLHSTRLKWSFGDLKGLHGDWQFALASQPARIIAATAAAVGFKGLVFDRGSYYYGGLAVERQIAAAARTPPIVSPDGRWAFYDLRPLAARLSARLGPGALRGARDAALSPLGVTWGLGVSEMESGTDHALRFVGSPAVITVHNPGRGPRSAVFGARVEAASGRAATLHAEWPGTSPEDIAVRGATSIRKTFEAPPGDSTITFTSDAPQAALIPAVKQSYGLRLSDPFVTDAREALAAAPVQPSPPATLLTPYGIG